MKLTIEKAKKKRRMWKVKKRVREFTVIVEDSEKAGAIGLGEERRGLCVRW